jgi:chemotaxis receptor (MCP) glutamine deamidase CheD/CheY-like chemotaxis protein
MVYVVEREGGNARTRAGIYVFPGQVIGNASGESLTTVLGASVSVCLFDPVGRRGGMNHFMLPSAGLQQVEMGRGKYSDYALPRLLSMALRSGSRKTDLVASVFGGGQVSGHLGAAATLGLFEVGRRNIDAAFLWLKEEGIPVVRHDTGGLVGRKIHMNTATNQIDVVAHQMSDDRLRRAERLETFRERKIRVLVIDDSRTVRAILRGAIESTDDLEVAGEAADPYEARERIMELDPDVLCLDIIMPRMDGVTFLRRVMRFRPIPTVIVSTMAQRGSPMRRKAELAGAVEVIDKEELALYRSTGAMEKILLPALRKAAATVVRATPWVEPGRQEVRT